MQEICITVPGKVHAPIFSHNCCSWLNLAWVKICQNKFVTLAGGCAPEASTLSPVTVSQICIPELNAHEKHNMNRWMLLGILCVWGQKVSVN